MAPREVRQPEVARLGTLLLALVLVHGATAEGKDDPRARRAARLLARAGFDVTLPTIAGLTRGRLRPDDVKPVIAAVAAAERPAVVVAVSVGSGPALLAAADPRVRDRVALVLTLGGYGSATELVRFYLTGDYEYGAIAGHRDHDPELVRAFVAANADIAADPATTSVLLDALTHYDWPGNVRELENVIHRAVVLARGPVIQLQDVPLDVAMPETARVPETAGATSLREACDQFERQYVLRVLERAHWNVSRAARLLGVHRNTILAKVAAWGIRRPGSERDDSEAL